MTSIAYRDGVLVSDSAVFDRGTYCGQSAKIGQAPDGTIGGGAGQMAEVSRFLEWMTGGMDGAPPKVINDDTECIFIRPDGVVWWLGHDCLPSRLDGDFFAIGSGFRIAIGAMAMGATAARAIEVCADLDSMTRRPLHALSLPGVAQ